MAKQKVCKQTVTIELETDATQREMDKRFWQALLDESIPVLEAGRSMVVHQVKVMKIQEPKLPATS